MSTVRRVYVEKKPEFAIKAKDLKHEIKHYLNIQTVTNVRELIRYDVENISDETYEKACKVVFAEPPVDICYQEDFPRAEGARVFSVEFLPGQFDQRADSAVQSTAHSTFSTTAREKPSPRLVRFPKMAS